MKKSILLGTAALAAVALAAPQAADAGETKIGGYYQFRMASMDNTPGDAAGDENANYWAQRLQLNVDMKASDKSHAHLVTRVLDNNTVQGNDATLAVGTTATTANWQVRQLWLETEAWGVGLKVGNMPVALNDGILVDHDVTSYGTILLSKNFGGVTVIGADVKVAEGSAMTVGVNANHMDTDLYVLSALGKVNSIDYQVTGAYLHEDNSVTAVAANPVLGTVGNGLGAKTGTGSVNDGWLALTLGGQIQGIDLTGTAIYETGMSNVTNDSQLDDSGVLLALRGKGKTGFGGWNAYAFYGSEDYTAPVAGGDQPHWSPTWDSGGAGAHDLMERALSSTLGGGANGAAATTNIATDVSNMWGVGAGLAINAGAWTIKPSLDYARLVEETITNGVAGAAPYRSAWGGTLGFSTKIQEGTTLDLSGTWVDPNRSNNAVGTAATEDTMHYLQASVKMDF
ncbi:MAG: hypothetical protein HQL93_13945 [Magnetococcales bacterium]|nr:hypothetical protein [Magnetococcales bacterium]